MFACPNCGGNILFDIKSQSMKCKYCDSSFMPEQIVKESDAVENNYFETTSYTCPQCGATLLGEENEAAVFCSFCGASDIMMSKMTRQKKPEYIIPFRLSKEDCVAAYKKKLKKAFYAPSGIVNKSKTESFRGIYIPFWCYEFSHDKPFEAEGKIVRSEGNYTIYETYKIGGEMKAEFDAVPFNSDAYFYDKLSNAIEPFNQTERKSFTPSYLSGFYADIPDVASEVYADDAAAVARSGEVEAVKKVPMFKKMSVDKNNKRDVLVKNFTPELKGCYNSYFPVWFLSYRYRDRVSYAVVNGQTGKVASDVPVSYGRYLFGTFLLAMVIYFFLELMFVPKPSEMLLLSAGISTIISYLYCFEIREIQQKDSLEGDKGLKYYKKQKKLKNGLNSVSEDAVEISAESIARKKNKVKNNPDLNGGMVYFWAAVIFACTVFAAMLSRSFKPVVPIMGAVALFASIRAFGYLLKYKGKKKFGILGSMFSAVLTIIVSLVSPPDDYIYYGLAFAAIATVSFTVADLISFYNILATRPLPQFDRTGGDDDAENL